MLRSRIEFEIEQTINTQPGIKPNVLKPDLHALQIEM